MDMQTAVLQLEQAGTAQARKIYLRHGARDPLYGVSYAVLNAMQKKIKKDHALALSLWATGNYDAMILALKVADPLALTGEQAEEWVWDVYNYSVSSELAGLVLRSPLAQEKAEAWIEADAEYVERTGWLILAGLVEKSDLSDSYFLNALQVIERDIHQSKNRVRDAMNTAVIGIGLRPNLTAAAIAAAGRIGKVVVDHGETGCKTADAVTYIQKTLDYRAKKAGK